MLGYNVPQTQTMQWECLVRIEGRARTYLMFSYKLMIWQIDCWSCSKVHHHLDYPTIIQSLHNASKLLIFGSIRVKKKTEKNWPLPKVFLDLSSPLDWLLMIWAIFRLLGPSRGPGGPSGGLGGSGEPEIVRFHMGPIFALRCHVLGQNNLTHYVFDIFGQIWALRAQKTPFWAKIGYTEKCLFPKTVSPNLAHIAPKRLLGTIF